VKVQNNINEKHDIHNAVNDQKRDLIHGLVFERGVIRDCDGGVKGQNQNEPIPDGLEETVMENDMWWSFWRL
jgi:hypothetical protein